MSKQIGELYHPVNNHPEPIYEGFSFPCLFLGSFWYLFKGMGLWALISFLAAMISWGLAWFIFPFFANEQHRKYLLKKGYLTSSGEVKDEETTDAQKEENVGTDLDKIKKLAELKDQGILTEEEFEAKKKELLDKM